MTPWYVAAMILVASPAMAWEGFTAPKKNNAADAVYYENTAANIYIEEFEELAEEEAEISDQPAVAAQPYGGSYYTNPVAPDKEYSTQ